MPPDECTPGGIFYFIDESVFLALRLRLGKTRISDLCIAVYTMCRNE